MTNAAEAIANAITGLSFTQAFVLRRISGRLT